MVDYRKKYKLSNNITPYILSKAGFSRDGKIRVFVYKELISLEIKINTKENDFSYEVLDATNNQFYAPYYYSYYGCKNLVAHKVEENIRYSFKKLEDDGILIKRKGKKNNEKDS